MQIIKEASIQDAWRKAKDLILDTGREIRDDDEELLEILDLFLNIENPETSDSERDVIDEEMKRWMLDNFREVKRIPELHDTPSYGWRLRDQNGKDQIAWVIKKLKSKRSTKSATIGTISTEDEDYIPCVSLLDFKIRNKTLIESCTCRSLDFGKKALYNFYSLSDLAHEVARAVGVSKISLNIYVISAHVYKRDT